MNNTKLTNNKKSIKVMAECALFSAIICVISPWIIPIGTIPISFGLFAVLFISSLTNVKQSILSVVIYILIGAIGVPVFAGPSGGFYKLIGLTGGYIVGYLACAFVTSMIINLNELKKWVFPLGMALGTISCYILGVIWFVAVSKNTITQALLISVVPFLPVDLVKIVAASFLGYKLRPKLKNV